MVGSNITVETFCDYQLTIGFYPPVDLETREATTTNDTIAVFDQLPKADYGVQQVFGTLTQQRNKKFFQLKIIFLARICTHSLKQPPDAADRPSS